MREGAESLRPDDSKVSSTTVVDPGEATVEDVCQHGHAETSDDRLAAFIVSVRNVAEQK